MLQEDIEKFLAEREVQEHQQQTDSSYGSTAGIENAMAVVQHFQTQLEERDRKIADLQYKLGEANGLLQQSAVVLAEKDKRLDEKDSIIAEKTAEIMEWKREIAISKETKRNKWKWPWQK
jgi:hypothetical protein